MKKILFLTTTLLTLLFSGCTAEEPGYFTNPPGESIDVAINDTVTVDGEVDSIITDEYGNEAEVTIMGELRTVEPVKLVGSTFIGTTVDPNFWAYSVNGSASVTQANGSLSLTTGTTANSAASVSSVRRGRYVAGSSMRYRAIIEQQSGTANNTRRWGVADHAGTFSITDGAYFKLDGTTFSVAYMAGGVETVITSGNFNGTLGASYEPGTGYVTYEIYWTNTRLQFVIGNQILHSVTITTGSWSNTPTLYLWADNMNSGGSTTSVTETIKAMSIYRLGSYQTAPIYKHISTATTTVCKYGAGTLHAIIMNNPTNNFVTIYDNIVAGGAVIAIINPGSSATPFELHYDADFYTGLTIVTAGAPDMTVIYE